VSSAAGASVSSYASRKSASNVSLAAMRRSFCDRKRKKTSCRSRGGAPLDSPRPPAALGARKGFHVFTLGPSSERTNAPWLKGPFLPCAVGALPPPTLPFPSPSARFGRTVF
jgi:hypothetical protein